MIRIQFFVFVGLFSLPADAQVNDVPNGHWARDAANQVVARGVMAAPGGKFNGAAVVTRRELAKTLASYARSLDKGWPNSGAKAVGKAHRDQAMSNTGFVTRYELAAVLNRAAGYGLQGVPRARGKVFGASEAFPPAPKVKLPSSDPSYESVKYLASKRMLFSNSALMNPGSQPVSPAELTTAIAQLLVGLNDQYTDEPQNRDEITPPPHRHSP